MSTAPITNRPARAADIEAFFGRSSDKTVRATVWERDGEILGIAGTYREGGATVVFSDMKPDAPKLAVWKASIGVMRKMTGPALCFACEGSGPFLERLGWVRQAPSEFGDIYAWQPSS